MSLSVFASNILYITSIGYAFKYTSTLLCMLTPSCLCVCVCVCVCVCADPDERAQDMIQDYQRECGNMRVKPVTKLLEQLEVHTYILSV